MHNDIYIFLYHKISVEILSGYNDLSLPASINPAYGGNLPHFHSGIITIRITRNICISLSRYQAWPKHCKVRYRKL